MAKTDQFIYDKAVDVQTVTLRRFLQLRAAAHIASGKAQKDTIGDTFRNNPAFASLLDEPLIRFLDAGFEMQEANPLYKASMEAQARAAERVAKSGEGDPEGTNARRRLYSHVDAIEENIIHQLSLAENRDVQKRYDNFLPRMTDSVVNPKKPGPLANRFRFRHENVGLLKKGLLDYVLKNPQDEHVVRALFMQIDLGFRPGEVERMPVSAYRAPSGTGRFAKNQVPGLFIPPGMTKMNTEINIPMSPDIVAYFKANMLRHQRLIGQGGVDALFVDNKGNPIKEGDMTRVLKQIEVRGPNGTGLMFDAETGKEILSLPRAYLLRNMNITANFALGTDAVTSGAMRGRAYRGAASIEDGYQGKVPGSHTLEETQPHIRLHTYFREQLTDAMGFSEDMILAPDQDIIGMWLQSGGKIDASQGTIGASQVLIGADDATNVNITFPYSEQEAKQMKPITIVQDAPPAALPAPEETPEERNAVTRDLLRGLHDPKLKAGGAAALLAQGLRDNESLDKEEVADFIVQTGLEEAAYFAGTKGLQALRVASSAANPVALGTQLATSMITPIEGGDITEEQRLVLDAQAAERRAAENIRPGGSGTTTKSFRPAIGTAEGAEEARLMDVFMEPDFGEGSPQDIMENVVLDDAAMQDIDTTPSFMAR
tara:strand:+ start:877 stop:2844 length:1968 start_codon:yes stop_codon:yes gene_type:complete